MGSRSILVIVMLVMLSFSALGYFDYKESELLFNYYSNNIVVISKNEIAGNLLFANVYDFLGNKVELSDIGRTISGKNTVSENIVVVIDSDINFSINHNTNNNYNNITLENTMNNTNNNTDSYKEVFITKDGFIPNVIFLNVGEIIVWKNNQDKLPVLLNGVRELNALKSGMVKQGESFSWEFLDKGEFTYVDSIVIGRVGKIVVN